MEQAPTLTVFVVDDEAACADTIRRQVENAGYSTRCFLSAEAFLAAVGPGDAGCVLLDLMLPGLDGFQLQEELSHRGVALPIVFLTGYGTVDRGVEAMKRGACDFLAKPVRQERLLAVVERALALGQTAYAHCRERQELLRRYGLLTGREREVFALLVQGLNNREMGEYLHISEKTVKVHRLHVRTKMPLSRLPDLVRAAELLGAGEHAHPSLALTG